MPEQPFKVSAAWARRTVVEAQHIPAPGTPGPYADAADVLRGIGLIQLDPLTRVSTAQRLTCLTRLPRTHRAEQVDAALWPGHRPVAFESFTKVACLFPLQDWALLELRRQHVRDTYAGSLPDHLRHQIREVVAAAPGGVKIGTLEKALSSARTTGWNWSEVKRAAELMVRTGELVITAREGVVRLFDLPERALPAEIRHAEELPAEQLRAQLAARAVSSLGVMTAGDFAHHYHLSRRDAADGIRRAGLVPIEVEGWKDTAYVPAEALDASPLSPPSRDAGPGPIRQARLIGPFDPLLRDRRRAQRVFGFDYTFEAYVPKSKRVYGHYVMGVLSGSELIGRVDLWRSKDELVLHRVFPEPGTPARSVVARARSAAGTLSRQLGTQLRLLEG
ncbi:DNA glycosylase AlkZ-like family protein [Nesterenkonia sphaerica]|uniref:Winged helix-turn-helix domain-containing protein n=1 Tax=Nesterenkonia sphaerica TaxID=1804988 RepID=A0A5R9A6W9_9MICC|nr:crosslink repair DNA glycosylase YcaQ family protein [Nesterenkonia sphaerica]TLP74469.1 winged helix-turn-helix domain-containing protein [Nesterenkonia sphaerica]